MTNPPDQRHTNTRIQITTRLAALTVGSVSDKQQCKQEITVGGIYGNFSQGMNGDSFRQQHQPLNDKTNTQKAVGHRCILTYEQTPSARHRVQMSAL